jgi:alpha 1,3-mannosyltransferase
LNTGDKETFWIGWELVGDQDYAFHKGDVGIMGKTEALTPLYEESRDDEEDIAAKKGHEREVDVTESAAITSPRLNFTVCAPQLLHLDIGGRPLWFNGGLLSNKFVEKKKKELGIFEVYLREPGENDGDNDSSWRLTDSNICCLTTDHTLSFDDDERVTLRMLAEFAKKAGAYGTGNPR